MRRRWPGSWPATTESLGKTQRSSYTNQKMNPEIHFSGFNSLFQTSLYNKFLDISRELRLVNLTKRTVHVIPFHTMKCPVFLIHHLLIVYFHTQKKIYICTYIS